MSVSCGPNNTLFGSFPWWACALANFKFARVGSHHLQPWIGKFPSQCCTGYCDVFRKGYRSNFLWFLISLKHCYVAIISYLCIQLCDGSVDPVQNYSERCPLRLSAYMHFCVWFLVFSYFVSRTFKIVVKFVMVHSRSSSSLCIYRFSKLFLCLAFFVRSFSIR
jgi:hypothetical protein